MDKFTIPLRNGKSLLVRKHPGGKSPFFYVRTLDPKTGRRTWHSLATSDPAQARARARSEIEKAQAGGDSWTQYRQQVEQRASLTMDALFDEYILAGYPGRDGKPRPPGRQRYLFANFLKSARDWWGPLGISTIKPADVITFLDTRRDCPRSGELQLNTVANVFRWAIRAGKIDRNPIAGIDAPRHQAEHCATMAPESPEELHQLCALLFQDEQTAPYGAQLMFQALTGLRPGEPGALRWDAAPGQPGSITPSIIDGKPIHWLHVRRLKHGINPAVRMHPALECFLAAWRIYSRRWDSPFYFPDPSKPDRPCCEATRLNTDRRLARHLARAALQLGIKARRRPHAMRAFYVRVRRSQGHLDDIIASELGERSGAALIVSTYGDAGTIRGDRRFDWLPASAKPAWHVLTDCAVAKAA